MRSSHEGGINARWVSPPGHPAAATACAAAPGRRWVLQPGINRWPSPGTFGESRPRMRTLGGADFQTAGLRVCLPGNSHAGSAKVLSGRRRKHPEDRLSGLADPKGVFANQAEVLQALQRDGADRVQHRAAAAWSNSAQGEGKWHGHAVLRTHGLPFWPKAAWRLGFPRYPMEIPSQIRHPAPRRDEGLCAGGFCQHVCV